MMTIRCTCETGELWDPELGGDQKLAKSMDT